MMPPLSTTERGNDFRNAVALLLRAAGFRNVETEIQVDYKNADVVGIWSRDSGMMGEQKFAFEAKNYSGTVPLQECTKFANDYGQLVNDGDVDQAWLISRGPISPEGRKAAEKRRNMKAMTIAELQRRLLLLDPYLKSLIEGFEASRVPDYYIRPETPDGADLERLVTDWVGAPESPPLFVLGGYGRGKSTFAAHLAAKFARAALASAEERAPILIKLGEIADEQSIDGLLGKVLASQHRVEGYHYETFRELNRAGRLLVIYDGFDEMKHGLTPTKFEQVFAELMKLDEGDARILILGRDTAFHDEAEFRAVIDGMVTTQAGRAIPRPGRRAYHHLQVRGFTPSEARDYVRRYLPIRALSERSGPAADPAWIDRRVGELVSGEFHNLLERPVHAQMLCEIAIQSDQLRPNMSVYELFDTFVHYLLHREVHKKGRDPAFTLQVRRRFNAALAWWLWERGGASTTTLADIPASLCEEATRDVAHSLGREEARRELIQGCLIEKGVNTIYFHRSLQEFLAAEHLIETDLLQRGAVSGDWLLAVTSAVTPEIADFIVAGADASPERRERASTWFEGLSSARSHQVPVGGFALIVKLARMLNFKVERMPSSPWLIWLSFFLRTGGSDFAHRGRNTYPVLANLLIASRQAPNEAQAAVLYLLARVLFHSAPLNSEAISLLLAAALPDQRLREAVREAQAKRSERQIIRRDEDFMLWCLLRAWRIEGGREVDRRIVIDLVQLHHDAMGEVRDGFADDGVEPQRETSLPVQMLYQGLAYRVPPIEGRAIEQLRPYFNNEEVRKLIAPIEVEHRQTVGAAGATPTGRQSRKTLRARPELRYRS
jgi:hypothetical protein